MSNNFLSFHHLSLSHIFSFIIFLLPTILHFSSPSCLNPFLIPLCFLNLSLAVFLSNEHWREISCCNCWVYSSCLFATRHSSFSISSIIIIFSLFSYWIFAVPFPEFSLAYNISPIYSFSCIHPLLFSYVSSFVSPGSLLKIYPFATNHSLVTNIKIILVADRPVFLHCFIFVVLCSFPTLQIT